MTPNEWLAWGAIMALMIFSLGIVVGWVLHRLRVERWYRRHMITPPYWRGS